MKPNTESILRPWLRHYDKHVPPALKYPRETLPDLFRVSTTKYSRRIAVKFLGKSLTYGQIEKSAAAFAAYLTQSQVSKGDRVLLMLPNSPHFVIAYYAILK